MAREEAQGAALQRGEASAEAAMAALAAAEARAAAAEERLRAASQPQPSSSGAPGDGAGPPALAGPGACAPALLLWVHGVFSLRARTVTQGSVARWLVFLRRPIKTRAQILCMQFLSSKVCVGYCSDGQPTCILFQCNRIILR